MTKTNPRIYVAGPISKGDLQENINNGIKAGMELLNEGYAVFIPHLNALASDTFGLVGSSLYERWLESDFSFISSCDAVLRIPGESAGADREVAFAKEHGVPVFYTIEDLKKNVFVKGDPRFHGLLSKIAALHNKKQQDYGTDGDPFANVRGSTAWGVPSWVGAMIRATDKVKRLQSFAQKGTLANEGVEDSLMDLAVYALIALVLYKEDVEKSYVSPKSI